MAINEPKANGPRRIPASNSPRTEGIFLHEKISPSTFAEKTNMHMVTIALSTGSKAIGCTFLFRKHTKSEVF
jgi:hypothetical protein